MLLNKNTDEDALILKKSKNKNLQGVLLAIIPSVLDNSGHFDRARVLRIVMKSGLKKSVECRSYLYTLIL